MTHTPSPEMGKKIANEAPAKTEYIGQVPQSQIDEWKRIHGTLFIAVVDTSVCYLKKPSRQTLSMASSLCKNDQIAFNELLLQDCWLGGDERIKSDDDLFISIGPLLADLLETKAATLKKI